MASFFWPLFTNWKGNMRWERKWNEVNSYLCSMCSLWFAQKNQRKEKNPKECRWNLKKDYHSCWNVNLRWDVHSIRIPQIHLAFRPNALWSKWFTNQFNSRWRNGIWGGLERMGVGGKVPLEVGQCFMLSWQLHKAENKRTKMSREKLVSRKSRKGGKDTRHAGCGVPAPV